MGVFKRQFDAKSIGMALAESLCFNKQKKMSPLKLMSQYRVIGKNRPQPNVKFIIIDQIYLVASQSVIDVAVV